MLLNTKVKKVPRLRFRGFSDEWQDFFLEDLFTNKGGTALEDQVEPDGSHKFISIGNYTTEGRYIDNGQRVNLNQKTKEKQLNNNDLVMVLNDKTSAGDLIGATILIDADKSYVYNQRSERIICSSKVTPQYSWFVLNSRSFRKKIYSISQGGTQIYVNFPVVKKLVIAIPEVQEQEKIAGFLGVVDDKTSALQNKKELLEKYKKGAMQAIFSQKIRFKDENGKDYPTWQEKSFGELFSFLRTNSLSRAELRESGTVKNIHYGDIHTKLSVNFDSSKESISYLSSMGNSDYCKPGDLIIADASEDRKDVGKSIEIINTNGDKIVAGLHTFLARPNQGIAVGFSGYLMQTSPVRKQIVCIATGASVLGISKTELSKITLKLPEKKEQQKIADFLTSLDDKINLTESKLEQAKRFKSSLLQQMFV